MNITEIRRRVESGEFEISLHAEKERYAENVMIADIEAAISNGEILEDYPEDPRGPSCLLLGYSKRRAIHIVCGLSADGWIRIITVYLPKPPKWLDARTRAKEVK